MKSFVETCIITAGFVFVVWCVFTAGVRVRISWNEKEVFSVKVGGLNHRELTDYYFTRMMYCLPELYPIIVTTSDSTLLSDEETLAMVDLKYYMFERVEIIHKSDNFSVISVSNRRSAQDLNRFVKELSDANSAMIYHAGIMYYPGQEFSGEHH